MKLIVSYFISVDSVVEAPETWHFPYISEDMGAYLSETINEQSAILFGRVTYEGMAAAWPSMTNNEYGIADAMNNLPKYVVSSTLKQLDWNNSHLIEGDFLESIRQLKASGEGIIGMTGSVMLVRELLKAKLVDELRLLVHPIVVGRGQRLFEDGVEHKLNFIDCRRFDSGVMLMTYQQA